MIHKLKSHDKHIAAQIYSVFQASYQIEADLIADKLERAIDFPPLSRSIEDIENSSSLFYGFFDSSEEGENQCLAAVIEVTFCEGQLDIESLTVSPEHFRKGIAGQLIDFVLNAFEFSSAFVETAVVNEPAIRLYIKHGFIEYKRFTPAHGIEKIALTLKMI